MHKSDKFNFLDKSKNSKNIVTIYKAIKYCLKNLQITSWRHELLQNLIKF